MPELPEVETIRRIVGRELVGQTLIAIEFTLPKLLRDSPLPDLGILVGRTLISAERRA
jgi:formamidopyrimidine-DNA glycosylase